MFFFVCLTPMGQGIHKVISNCFDLKSKLKFTCKPKSLIKVLYGYFATHRLLLAYKICSLRCGKTNIHFIVVTWARVVCLLCTPVAQGPQARGQKGVHIRQITSAHVTTIM